MQEDDQSRVRKLLISARIELEKQPGRYRTLIEKLKALETSLGRADFDYDLLRSVLYSFPLELQPTRGVIPKNESKSDARLLWEELNRIVISRQQPGIPPKDKRK